MSNEELKLQITTSFPNIEIDDSGEWLNCNIASTDLVAITNQLRHEDEFNFDYLFCLTCVDWKTHLTIVYHLSSTIHHHNIVLKSKLDRETPQIETVSHIWRTAEFHEREVYEMFGVNFMNHPDLRLLILPDGWEGKNPMRKDFEDPINMIKL